MTPLAGLAAIGAAIALGSRYGDEEFPSGKISVQFAIEAFDDAEHSARRALSSKHPTACRAARFNTVSAYRIFKDLEKHYPREAGFMRLRANALKSVYRRKCRSEYSNLVERGFF